MPVMGAAMTGGIIWKPARASFCAANMVATLHIALANHSIPASGFTFVFSSFPDEFAEHSINFIVLNFTSGHLHPRTRQVLYVHVFDEMYPIRHGGPRYALWDVFPRPPASSPRQGG